MNERYPGCTFQQVDLLEGNDKFTVGCTLKNGKIKPGLVATNTGLTPLPTVVHFGMSEIGRGIIVYTSDNFMRLADNSNGLSYYTNYNFKATYPFSFECNNGNAGEYVLVGNEYYLKIAAGVYSVGPFTGRVRYGAIRRGRLFGADRVNAYLLRWSGDGGWNDWTEGLTGAGSVRLDPPGGEIVRVFNFNEELVVVRKTGITFITIGGNPETFKVGKTVIIPPVYNAYSSIIVGNALYIYTADGLYSYKGGKIAKEEGLISADMTTCNYMNKDTDRYLITSGVSAKLGRTVVYVYDVTENVYQVVDVPAMNVGADTTSIIAFCQEANYRIAAGNSYTAYCGTYDFGSPDRKLLTGLEIDCDNGVDVEISNGTYTRTVRGAKGRMLLNMRGTKFTVSISGGEEVRSAKLTAEVRN